MSRVEDVLSKLGVEHRAQGNRAWAERCPLPNHGKHNESHLWQNWFIRLDRGEWSGFHCFSCKQKGTLLDLVMILRDVPLERVREIQRRSEQEKFYELAKVFPELREARDWVREIASAETEAPFLRVRSEVARAPGAIDVPAGVEMMGASLAEWNSVPRDYLLSRGVTDGQVRRWKIGYSLMGRLEGRIFLPIFDAKGRLANYAARSFVGAEKRYLAAGTWEAPDKSALWGEHLWGPPAERGTVWTFEGAVNGLAIERALREAGVDAALGGMSGLDEGAGGQVEVRTLMKLVTFRRVVVATDPDGPGDRAAAGIARALRGRAEVARLELPAGADAADLWRKDRGALLAAVREVCAA